VPEIKPISKKPNVAPPVQFEEAFEDGKGVIKTRSGLMTVDKTIQFMDAFYKNGGNATEAAMDTFDCSTRASASEMGRKYLAKAEKRGLVASYLENNKIGYGELIQHAFEMMKKSKNPGWWDRLMREAGYAKEDPIANKKAAAPVSVNVFQAHKSLTESYLEGEEISTNNNTANIIDED